MRKRNKISVSEDPVLPNPVPFDLFSVVFSFCFGLVLAATMFLSGEQNERSGIVHFLAVLWLLTGIIWIFWPRIFRKPSPRIRFSRYDVVVYLFFATVIISILWNLVPGQGGSPRPSWNMLSVWLVFASAWFLFRQLLSNVKSIGGVWQIVVAVMLSQAVLGLYQQFVGIPSMIRQFEADPVAVVAQVDPEIKQGSPDWDRVVARMKTAGPMGTFPMSNTLGGLLGTGFVFLAGFQFLQQKREERYKKWIGGILTATIMFCFVLTKCRSGYVAVAVGLAGLLAIWFLRRTRSGGLKKTLMIGCGIVGLLVAVSLATSGKSILSGAGKSLGYRLEYWTSSLEMIRDYPLLGCGSGNFKPTYMKYKLPGASEEISDPHNFLVEIAAVSGIPAMILFLVPIVASISYGFRRFEPSVVRPEFSTFNMSIPALTGGGLFGSLLGILFSFYTEAPIDIEAALIVLLAFPMVAWTFQKRFQQDPAPPVLIALTLFVLLIHLLAAGGISVSSTAIFIWIFAAILLNEKEQAGTAPGIDSKYAILFAVVFVVSLLVVQYFGLRPVIGSQALVSEAGSEPKISRRIDLLEKAVSIDPWSAEIREQLATELFRASYDAGQWALLKKPMLESQRKTLELAPRSAKYYHIFAERLNVLGRTTGDTALRDEALKLYEESIRCYPNHAKFRAPYALALWNAGRKDEAGRQKAAAIHLNDVMDHADQKLPVELLEKLDAIESP